VPSGGSQWLLNKIADKDGKTVGTMLLDVESIPDFTKSWRLYLTFKYEGRPLPTSEEFDAFDLADQQIQELCEKFSARNVAIWMSNGVRDWIVYIDDPEIFKRAAETAFKNQATITADLDPQWSQYHNLLEMVRDVKLGKQR
jgi:hypothetical protein